MHFLNKYESQSYALMRIVTGFLFLWHGTQKFLDFPKAGPELNAMMTVGGGVELIGGLLLMVGLLTRQAAFICSGTMAVAYWVFHVPGSNPLLPMLNGGELAIMFCFVFLFISCKGAGIWSVDAARK
ncbi:MAG: putative oxidoreductase [Saprospiraceae bacterium]|jgi:putative oxidoreductase